ncbi:Putative Amidohydrolase family protein; hippurate hydrolase (Benzoylglycine amidohydrolase) [Neorhizobium galegae bv. officinalis bv. officinalis str. HAMBI 1141]|uniref:Putative Amidohydrolase family protein hippurate hydrolase (Benzoylglycine amidohydrolase) n=1 Tax=Neorhizobium galegae bv. officinalis bv. officinalis str. HAMBI 1141 TaxID=1028801 RepID=A0A068TCU2_NEOGA|nr:M20 aminoacylase family protein [Neorhizobium galegae]CDN55894.1 Putative Amidohydrolase family protein; hippurate hydrolase (Benzoylglycine amidohydrolase) [Neorhizobium galegae bv. officinalis bv. officinalis str. HAMBI 1141]
MPILNRAAELQGEVSEWRRYLHENPEILYEVENTASFVEQKLKEFGVDEVVPGIGRTGVVGVIRGKGPGGRTIGLRADMDALPLTEITGKPWASKVPGKMHACGHDGHTSMLLGAAKYLAETRNFNGTVALIFQPAEEGGAGALAMVDDGMMERFGIEEVYGMHNMPGIPLGQFAIRKGGIMAAPDRFTITIKGRGGHAAQPHRTIDPIFIGSQLVGSLQAIAARNADPVHSVVISVTRFDAGTAYNIIPDQATLWGTVRTLSEATRDLAENRIRQIVEGIVSAHGAEAEIDYYRQCPVTFNHDLETEHAIGVATEVVGAANVDTNVEPTMAGEDFAFMLKRRPGAFIFIGNGDTAALHNPHYDFDDEAISYGISYWVRLAEQRLTE